jgi:hypothetical protein
MTDYEPFFTMKTCSRAAIGLHADKLPHQFFLDIGGEMIMAQDGKKDWKELATLASVEPDPNKLIQLVEELNAALDQETPRFRGGFDREGTDVPVHHKQNPAHQNQDCS